MCEGRSNGTGKAISVDGKKGRDDIYGYPWRFTQKDFPSLVC